MIAATQKKEVILDVAGEGGGYTILGEQHHGRWRFWRDPGSGDAWMFDDDNDDNQVNVESARTKPTPEPAIDYCDTLDEVLKKINVNWPRLYPLQVHPSFASDILQRVSLYLAHTSAGSASRVTSIWQEWCFGEEFGADAINFPSLDMEILKNGQRIKHTTQPECGLGQLQADENDTQIPVFFVDPGLVNFSAQARHKLELVVGAEAHSIHLDHMALPTRAGSKTMVTLPQAKQRFLAGYPGGFYDDLFMHDERDYKVALAGLAREWLGRDVLAHLIENERYEQVCENATKLMAHPKNNLPSFYEKMTFKNGFIKLNNPKVFALSLFAYLHGAGDLETRFTDFSNVMGQMQAAKWPIITCFRFFLFPSTDVYIKPTDLQHAAKLSWFEINYKPQLNWLTYHSVLAFYQSLAASTADLNPRDMIDVQSFIWCIDPHFRIP